MLTYITFVVNFPASSALALRLRQNQPDVDRINGAFPLRRSKRGDGLSQEERAFYDALVQNDGAVDVMSNDKLRIIATELVVTMPSNTGTDWWRRENVRAKMRVAVKKLLQMHGYPPDLAPAAIKLILKQAEA